MKIILLENANAMSIQNKRMRNMVPKLVSIQVANLCVVIVTEALNQSENVLFIKTVSFLSGRPLHAGTLGTSTVTLTVEIIQDLWENSN